MKKPFERLTAHGCAIYQGDKQVATTDPGRMSGADGDEMPSMEDIARAKMLAAAPQAFEALFWMLRSCRMAGPVGTTAYLIPEAQMDTARGAFMLAGIDWEKMPAMRCTKCAGSGSCLDERTIGRGICPNCNGNGETRGQA